MVRPSHVRPGDILIRKQVTGTVAFCADGNIFIRLAGGRRLIACRPEDLEWLIPKRKMASNSLATNAAKFGALPPSVVVQKNVASKSRGTMSKPKAGGRAK